MFYGDRPLVTSQYDFFLFRYVLFTSLYELLRKSRNMTMSKNGKKRKVSLLLLSGKLGNSSLSKTDIYNKLDKNTKYKLNFCYDKLCSSFAKLLYIFLPLLSILFMLSKVFQIDYNHHTIVYLR